MAVTTSSISIKDGSANSQSGAVLADPAGIFHSIVSTDEAGMAVYRTSASFTRRMSTSFRTASRADLEPRIQ